MTLAKKNKMFIYLKACHNESILVFYNCVIPHTESKLEHLEIKKYNFG